MAPALRVAPADKVPAAERAGIHVRELLFSGRLRTGDRIDQNQIAAALGISRQPVREAVLELADEGLLVIRPQHGVFVGRFDAALVRGHYELNGYLEAYAAAKVALNGDPATLERLGELHEIVLRSRDVVELQAASTEFYRTINVAAGNPRLRNALRILQRFVPGSAFARYPAMVDIARSAGSEVLSAIERHDPEAASAACTDQWHAGGELVVADLIARGIVEDDPPAPAPPRPRARRR